MANAITQLSSLSSDTAAFDRLAYFALRDQMYFDQAADVKPTNQTSPGSSVKFTIYTEMTAATSALSETADIDSVALADAQVEVTLTEYGNAVITGAKMRGTSFLNVDEDAANLVGFNAGDSMDTVVQAVIDAGTNVTYGGAATSRTTLAATGTNMAALDIRKVRAKLAAAKSLPRVGSYYIGFIHPDVALDLMSETGNAAWSAPHVNVDTANIYQGSIGSFAGVAFIETPRVKVRTNASNGSGSAGTVDSYATYIMGRQAFAKAFANTDGNGPLPQIVHGPVVDSLMRLHPVGWKWLGGYGIFREASLRRIETSSSIGVV